MTKWQIVTVWMVAWAAIGLCCFIIGFDAIPRFFNYSSGAAFMLGWGYAAILIAPLAFVVVGEIR